MRERNSIQIIDEGEKLPDLPKGLKTDIEAISLFGFKIVEFEGKAMWQAGSEQDYRESEAKRLEISPDDVVIDTLCHQTGPTSCSGGCNPMVSPPRTCRLLYNPTGHYYYCSCV